MAVRTAARVRADSVGASAVDLAREAADQVAEPGTVGEHLRVEAVAERLVTHRFACTARGYRGWLWTVTLARAPRAKQVTVCEVELIAADDAVLAPQWLPWSQRLRPGDVGPGDVLPRVLQDERLEPGFEATGEEDVDQVALWEFGLGRPRVLSRHGREEAGTRWDAGEFGPASASAQAAAAHCRSCGFLSPVPGVMRQAFGICANEWSPADGRVVSLLFGCGAHSETDADVSSDPVPEHARDDQLLESVPSGSGVTTDVVTADVITAVVPDAGADVVPASPTADGG